MVDNNEGIDTSQQNANPVFNENAAFSSEENSDTLSPADAFAKTLDSVEASEPIEQPSQPQPQEIAQPVQNNDETRYQYWQSQADKEKNENTRLRDELNYLKGQQSATEPQGQQPVQKPIAFPDPPEKPRKPGGNNREEAYSDPSSASAQYMDEVEDWRDTMDEYNVAKSNYNTAIVQERVEAMEQNRLQEQRVRAAKQQEATQMANLRQHVSANYSMDQAETNDFIQKMSDPNSISMDNLFQLYRMNNGTENNAPVQQQPAQGQPQPSPTFTQTQRAQQVPQPMGVQPSTGHVEQNPSDQIMDKMISDYKDNNPW